MRIPGSLFRVWSERHQLVPLNSLYKTRHLIKRELVAVVPNVGVDVGCFLGRQGEVES